MERIVFLDRDTVNANFRKPSFEHRWDEFGTTSPDETAERTKDATIIITNKVKITADIVEASPKLRFVAVAATGTDCVDINACREAGIAVSNVKDYSVRSVPEHVFSLVLALRRNLIAYNHEAKDGTWQASDIFCGIEHPISELAGSNLGIIGFGSLGKAVATIASAFGMNILIAERKNAETIRDGYLPFDEVLERADVLTLHCPLNVETRGIIGKDDLQQMKQSSILINCGRGGLVDENALANALKDGAIAGAGVDVLSQEPPKNGNPLLEPGVTNLIVTPHNAWASLEAMQVLADAVLENLEAFVSGEPQNLV